MKLATLLGASYGIIHLVRGSEEMEISSLCLDSRKASPGCLFMAMAGTKANGADYVEDAVSRGATCILVQEDVLNHLPSLIQEKAAILTAASMRKAAGVLSNTFFGSPSSKLNVVGITGTNGKTTCTYILEQIFKAWGKKTAISGTICQRIGQEESKSCLTTPDCVSFHAFLKRCVDEGVDFVITEVSSHALDQGRVAGCRFALSLFTNLTRDHLDYHGNLEEYFRAKSQLFTSRYTNKCVINMDDAYGKRLFDGCTLEKLSYSLSSPGADVHAREFILGSQGIEAILDIMGQDLHVESKLIGRFNLLNIIACVCAARFLGVPEGHIAGGIRAARSVPGRLEKIESCGVSAFVDYAHTPDAVKNVLEGIREIKGDGLLITVIGCGGDRDKGKRPEMARISAKLSDLAVFTSDNPRSENPLSIIRDMLHGVPKDLRQKVRIIEDRAEAIRWACAQATRGDLIVVAGKGHEDYQIIGGKRWPFTDKQALEEAFYLLSCKAREERRSCRTFCPTLENVVRATDGECDKKHLFIPFDSVCTDTRTLVPGAIFWALKGEKFDGRTFVSQAFKKGAVAAVCQKGKGKPDVDAEAPIIFVEDSLYALGQFASWYRRFLGLKTIAITGSCGKTTTKDLVASVVSQTFKTQATEGNFNNLIGLPLTLFSMRPGVEWAVVEMGTSLPGEIKRLCEIACPEVGIITCIRPVHLEGLGDIKNISQEKGYLFESLPESGTAIVNLDDQLVCENLARTRAKNIWGFGTVSACGRLKEAAGRVILRSWQSTEQGLVVGLDASGENLEIRSRLFGSVNAMNIAAAVATGLGLGISMDDIVSGIEKCPAPKARMNIEVISGWIVIDDTYNANPASMEAALHMVSEHAPGLGRNLVLGDMLELGQDAERFHFELGQKAAQLRPRSLVAVGEMADVMATGAKSQGLSKGCIFTFKTAQEAASFLAEEKGLFFNGTRKVVLLKGSRGVCLEKVASVIRKRLERGV